MHQPLKWQPPVGERSQAHLTYSGEQFPDGRVPAEIGPEYQGVQKQPDKRLGLDGFPVRDGDPNYDVVDIACPLQRYLKDR